jgi:L-2-hydroxyglutarate oxidase LhgO
VIRQERPWFVNLVGMDSPGLTASLAIGRYVRTKSSACRTTDRLVDAIMG